MDIKHIAGLGGKRKSALLHTATLPIDEHTFWRIEVRQLKNTRLVVDTRRWRRLPDGSVKATGNGIAASVERWLELLQFSNRIARDAGRG